jgi:uncharacterized protein YjdB
MKGMRALAILGALLLGACGDGSVRSPDFRPVLIGLSLTPTSANIAIGESQEFQAIGTFSAAPGSDVESTTAPVDANFSIGDSQIASVNNNGVVTGVGNGVTQLTASVDGFEASASITVRPPTLNSISVTPDPASVEVNDTVQFTATGTFQNGSDPEFETDITQEVTWSTGNSSVATITADGLATGGSVGTTTVQASLGGVSDSATLNVTPEPQLIAIAVTPDPASVEVGSTIQFTATGTFQAGTMPTFEEDLTTRVSWSSSDTSVASINGAGVATGIDEGSTTIEASLNGETDSVTLTVTPFEDVLIGIEVTPETVTEALGRPVQFTATGTYETGPGSSPPTEERDVTTAVAWSSSDESIATIDDSGVADSLQVGTATITAMLEGFSDTATLTIGPPELESIVIVDPDADPPVAVDQRATPLGTSVDYQALGFYTDSDSPRAIDGTVEWTSSDTDVATVDPVTGALTEAASVSTGTTTVTATSGELSDTTQLEVTAAELTGVLRVEPPIWRLVPGTSIEFEAIGTFTDSSEAEIDDANLDWTSSDPNVAVIDADGVATGNNQGDTTITATLKSEVRPSASPRSATADLRVTNPVCDVPLLASEGATVTPDVNGLCIGCEVTDSGNIIDDALLSTFGTLSTTVGLLNGEVSVTVNAQDTAFTNLPFEAGERPGFIIGSPTGQLVLVELLSQISISTLLDGTVQETSSTVTPLRVDLLGAELIGGSDLAVVSLTATRPYDAIRLSFQSGVATALSDLRVSAACGTTLPLEAPAPLVDLVGVQLNPNPVVVDRSSEATLIGEFEDGSTGPVPDSDIVWTSSAPDVATVDAQGSVEAMSVGMTDITATLRDGAAPEVMPRSATEELEVIEEQDVCTNPILASEGETASGSVNGLCLLCNTPNPENIIDGDETTFGTLNVGVGLLGGNASFLVTSEGQGTDAAPIGRPGFIISRPAGGLVLVEALPQIEIATLLDGSVQETSNPATAPLRLDLLGIPILGAPESGLVSFEATRPFDAVRITLNSGLVGALTQLQVSRACADSEPLAP